MGREVFKYQEVDANDFLRVNQSTITLEFFHTATYATSGATSTTLPVADRGGFADGDGIYVGTDDVTINTGGGTTGAGNFTISASTAFANNDAVVLHTSGGSSQRATWYDDPDFATGSSAAITLDSNNEAVVFLKPGQYGVRFASGGSTLRTDYHEVVEELDWVTVTPGHASGTAGISEAINKLSSDGGTVYIGPGTFTITEQLPIEKSNVRIMGAGRDITTIKMADSTVISPINEGMIEISSGLSNIQFIDLTIDGNVANQTTPQFQGIRTNTGVTDLHIRNCNIKNIASRGIFVRGGSINTRIFIKDNTITNCGWRGIEVAETQHAQIINNHVEQTGGHGITLEPGASADTDYCRGCMISGNYIDRSAAPTTQLTGTSYAGFLIGIGSRSEDISVTSNICIDNSAAGGTDGIGWGHESGASPWTRVVIDGNLVTNTGAFGIDAMGDCVISNNVVHKAGTHGIRYAPNAAPATMNNNVITGNVVIDCDEDDAGGKHGISIACDADTTINKAVVSSNIVKDTRGTPRMAYSLSISKNGGASGTINDLIIVGNDLESGTTASIDWSDPPSTVTGLVIRDNITQSGDPYRGEATLSSGTVAVQNTNWPALTDLKFVISKTDENSSSAHGILEGTYDGTDTLTITSRLQSTAKLQLTDETASQGYPQAAAAQYDLQWSGGNMPVPAALPIDAVYFLVSSIAGGTSIDVFLTEDGVGGNTLTSSTTVTTAGGAVWYSLTGNGTVASTSKVLKIEGENEVGNVTTFNVSDTIVVFGSGTGTQTGDTSKVYWEMVGQ